MQNKVPRGVEFLERFQAYLRILAEVGLDHTYHRKVSPSDIVQETLLQAHMSRHQFRGRSDAEAAAWLRRILARKLSNAIRDLRLGKRDLRRERPLDEYLNLSSVRLQSLIDSETTPPGMLDRKEVVLRVSDALDSLPEDQRQAVLLKHIRDVPLAEIASLMSRSPASVAGLLRRGLKSLRESLRNL
jgi:RNA polymerase sigma-70 factor, ECF subfamily